MNQLTVHIIKMFFELTHSVMMFYHFTYVCPKTEHELL